MIWRKENVRLRKAHLFLNNERKGGDMLTPQEETFISLKSKFTFSKVFEHICKTKVDARRCDPKKFGGHVERGRRCFCVLFRFMFYDMENRFPR